MLELLQNIGIETRKVSTTNGGEYASPCPWCGGEDRFLLWPEEGNGGRYWCRQCNRSGDTIQFLRDYHGMTYPDACKALGQTPKSDKSNRPHRRPEWTPKPETIPDRLWQEKATAFVQWCEARLWSPEGKNTLAYLIEERRLTEETIRVSHLGFNPESIYRRKSSWGIRESVEDATLWLPPGLVIPFFEGDQVSQIRIRIPEERRCDDTSYCFVPGGSSYPFLIGECRNVIIIVESGLDAILAYQETKDFASALYLGAVSYRPTERAWQALQKAPCVLNVLDSDDAGGTQSWTWWQENLPKAKRWPVTKGKDITEAAVNGLNLREWVLVGALGDETSVDSWQERAAIMEYDGNMDRSEAEHRALLNVKGWSQV